MATGGRLPRGLIGEGSVVGGSAAEVVSAFDRRMEPGELVGVKLIPRDRARGDEHLRDEVLQLRRLVNHKHIVAFRELMVSEDSVCVVVEWVRGGSLRDYVQTAGCLQENLARWFMQQLIVALDYSHKLGMCDRDLRLGHLLLEDEKALFPVVRLMNFGAREGANGDNTPGAAGAGSATPPEVVHSLRCGAGPHHDGFQADVWRAACCLYRMLFGVDAAIGLSPEWRADSPPDDSPVNVVLAQARRLSDGQLLPPVSDDCMDFLSKMLQVRPGARMTMEQVWQHPWFQTDLPATARQYNDLLMADVEGLEGRLERIQTDQELVDVLMIV